MLQPEEIELYNSKRNEFLKLEKLLQHKELLQCVANGNKYKEMQAILFKEIRTMQSQVYELKKMCGCKTPAALMILAHKYKVIE